MSTIKLKSNDERYFTVNVDVAKLSKTIETMIDLSGVEDLNKEAIPLPQVSGDILEKVIEWAIHHKENPPAPVIAVNPREKKRPILNEWEEQFLNVDDKTYLGIFQAANYLEMRGLLALCAKRMANILRGKTFLQIKERFRFITESDGDISSTTNPDTNDDRSGVRTSTPVNVGPTSGKSDEEMNILN